MRRFRVKFKVGERTKEDCLTADPREGRDAGQILMLVSTFLK